ncbi:hypothetical protein BDV95DRAFT_269477 [Massariosphaeria phaeospora]|uniref:Secreted protein n=1 Tax=Massariosphaeria phaeospora TaxID=100035 RepID=A0A7C8MB29_9PLEO|nr:hypothetical protein BDV95DRAFT_269477 [Massariosphaeria phaeospora]
MLVLVLMLMLSRYRQQAAAFSWPTIHRSSHVDLGLCIHKLGLELTPAAFYSECLKLQCEIDFEACFWTFRTAIDTKTSIARHPGIPTDTEVFSSPL